MTAVRNFIITFLLSLLIFGLIAYGLLEFAISAFRLGASENENQGTEAPDISGPDITINNDVKDVVGNSFTALLLGSDYLPDVYDDYDVSEENETAELFPIEPRTVQTDTILLVRVNKETGECLICAIPANTQIKIDGHTAKLKELYAAKGMDALCTQVMALTGLTVDYYAMITLDNMSKLIDEFQGITYTVPVDMHYVDKSIGFEIDLRAGSQNLDGKKATSMLRYWLYNDGDTSRRQCAVDFFKAFCSKAMNEIDPKDAPLRYTQLVELLEITNFSLQDLADNVDLIFSYNKMTISDYTYPGNTTTAANNETVFVPNTAKAIEFFSQYKFKG